MTDPHGVRVFLQEIRTEQDYHLRQTRITLYVYLDESDFLKRSDSALNRLYRLQQCMYATNSLWLTLPPSPSPVPIPVPIKPVLPEISDSQRHIILDEQVQ